MSLRDALNFIRKRDGMRSRRLSSEQLEKRRKRIKENKEDKDKDKDKDKEENAGDTEYNLSDM